MWGAVKKGRGVISTHNKSFKGRPARRDKRYKSTNQYN